MLIDNVTYDISKIPLFRQYDKITVDPLNRVKLIDSELKYSVVSYKDYISDSQD